MLAPVRTEPPSGDIVSLEEMIVHCRVDGDEDRDLLKAYLQAAVEHLDGYSGILGQALVEQTWKQAFGGFSGCMRLPVGPYLKDANVDYFDGSNQPQTLAASVFQVLTDARGPFLALKPDQSWPGSYGRPDAVSVTYKAGFGNAAAVPAPIRQAIRMTAATWYANRHTVKVGETVAELPFGATMLLAPYRRVGV
jgi:uncharacterized phiE125 gp8 family phage protein